MGDQRRLFGPLYPTAGEPRPYLHDKVQHFGAMMEEKLAIKAKSKNGWTTMRPEDIFILLAGEIGELADDLKRQRWAEAIWEAVDVANFAMMLADVVSVRLESEREASLPPPSRQGRTDSRQGHNP